MILVYCDINASMLSSSAVHLLVGESDLRETVLENRKACASVSSVMVVAAPSPPYTSVPSPASTQTTVVRSVFHI